MKRMREMLWGWSCWLCLGLLVLMTPWAISIIEHKHRAGPPSEEIIRFFMAAAPVLVGTGTLFGCLGLKYDQRRLAARLGLALCLVMIALGSFVFWFLTQLAKAGNFH